MRRSAEAEAAAWRGLAVRPARIEDAEAMAPLSVQLGYVSSRREVERRLAPLLVQPEHTVLVAEVGDSIVPAAPASPKIVAWIHAFVKRTVESDPAVEIGGLVVDEAWRRLRVGRLLMEHAERWARTVACTTVTVRSSMTRRAAHAFYQSLGYTMVKRQKVFRKTLER
jgi:GNAT superfamily N-acetyltransferase